MDDADDIIDNNSETLKEESGGGFETEDRLVEDEVYFGPMSKQELHKSQKYLSRRTVLFANNFRQDRKLMRYTLQPENGMITESCEEGSESTVENLNISGQENEVFYGSMSGVEQHKSLKFANRQTVLFEEGFRGDRKLMRYTLQPGNMSITESCSDNVPEVCSDTVRISSQDDPDVVNNIEVLSQSLIQDLLPPGSNDDSCLFSDTSILNESQENVRDTIEGILHLGTLASEADPSLLNESQEVEPDMVEGQLSPASHEVPCGCSPSSHPATPPPCLPPTASLSSPNAYVSPVKGTPAAEASTNGEVTPELQVVPSKYISPSDAESDSMVTKLDDIFRGAPDGSILIDTICVEDMDISSMTLESSAACKYSGGPRRSARYGSVSGGSLSPASVVPTDCGSPCRSPLTFEEIHFSPTLNVAATTPDRPAAQCCDLVDQLHDLKLIESRLVFDEDDHSAVNLLISQKKTVNQSVFSPHCSNSKREVKSDPQSNTDNSKSSTPSNQVSVFERLYNRRKTPQSGQKSATAAKCVTPVDSTTSNSNYSKVQVKSKTPTPKKTPTRIGSSSKQQIKPSSAGKLYKIKTTPTKPKPVITTGSLNRQAISAITYNESSSKGKSPNPNPPIYRRGTPKYVSPYARKPTATSVPKENLPPIPKFDLDESSIMEEPTNLDDSMLLAERRQQLKELQQQRIELQARIALRNEGRVANGSKMACSPLHKTSPDNQHNVRHADICPRSERDLDALTMAHTMCNSQQVTRVITKPTVATIIKLSTSQDSVANSFKSLGRPSGRPTPREARCLQWGDVEEEEEDTTKDPPESPTHPAVRRSILTLRSPSHRFPYNGELPSPIVLRKSARKLRLGQTHSAANQKITRF